MNKNNKKRWLQLVVSIILLLVVAYTEYNTIQEGSQDQSASFQDGSFEMDGSKLQAHFLDVGQADCTILVSDGEALLVDAGNNGDAELILGYLAELEQQGIMERLVCAVGTHSHEDHVGALDAVLAQYQPEYVILPEENNTTKTYRDVLSIIEEKNISLVRPVPGDSYSFGQADFQILGPVSGKKSSPNGYSVCLKVTFGENRFLFTGDAEEPEEKEMLELWRTSHSLECDVFQAGHHGSNTSNSYDFLKAADPVYVVISCGVDNSYGHPHEETLAEFVDQDIQVYRTDLQGTIIAISDGKNIHMTAQGKK